MAFCEEAARIELVLGIERKGRKLRAGWTTSLAGHCDRSEANSITLCTMMEIAASLRSSQ
jgi:hypothetical protein